MTKKSKTKKKTSKKKTTKEAAALNASSKKLAEAMSARTIKGNKSTVSTPGAEPVEKNSSFTVDYDTLVTMKQASMTISNLLMENGQKTMSKMVADNWEMFEQNLKPAS